ncbi:MAG: radical SAM protein [Candidatus Electrothrix sp. AUS1_2]|nr:radical SAM protein [Candidatus Electrothrix sp. AUS1_2]
MKITLVAPTPPDVAAFGVRALSAYLKQHGHSVKSIFLPGGVEKYKDSNGFTYNYQEHIIRKVIELCQDADLIGVSFMSHYLDRAKQLCQALKANTTVPVIVGGIHPTVQPEECLEFADIVCRGEGEQALLEIIQRMERHESYYDIENLYFRQDGNTIRNPLRPLQQDLDALPFFDYEMDGQYIFDNLRDDIVPMNKEMLKNCFPLEPHVEGSFSDSYHRTLSYKTMTTRGCPHHCTFCAEKTLADMYSGQRYLRKRGVNNIITELLWVKKELPFVQSIFLFDDTFLSRTTDEIIEFAKEYKKQIAMPFHIQASPGTVTAKKIEVLIDAGLAFVEMGIQSMSNTGKDLYKRKTTEKSILDAAAIFHSFRKQIYPPCYHVILDNPWETSEDVLETLDTILKLPRPFWLKRSSLVLFPGTELNSKAKAEGLLKTKEDERREIYCKHLHTPKGSYVNFLMYLAGFSYFPRFIIKLLKTRFLVRLFDRNSLSRCYIGLYNSGENLIIVWKGIRSLFKGDFARIYKFFHRVR